MTKKKFDGIRKARVIGGYTQEEIAQLLGISTGTYSLKESGKSDFTATELKALSDLFDTSADELLA